MTKYLISFPAAAMQVPADEMPPVAAADRAVILEAKAASVDVLGGGIAETVAAERVAADGALSTTHYPGSDLTAGFTILELPCPAAARVWARTIAVACRCAKDVRAFMLDPIS